MVEMNELKNELDAALGKADRLQKLGALLAHSSKWLGETDNKALAGVVGAEIDKLANGLWWDLTWARNDLEKANEPEETQPEAVEAEEPLL